MPPSAAMKSKESKRRANAGRKSTNQNNTSIDILKRLKDLSSFLDNEPSGEVLLNEDEMASIEIQNLKIRMNKLNLDNSLVSSNHDSIATSALSQFSDLNNSDASTSPNLNFHHNSKSRLPSYVANGEPLGYKQPSMNYQLHQSMSSNNFRSDSRLSNSSLVPSQVSSIHNSHLTSNCSNTKTKSAKKQCSAPDSLLATPVTSSLVTPSESRRSSKQMKKSESESFNHKDNVRNVYWIRFLFKVKTFS